MRHLPKLPVLALTFAFLTGAVSGVVSAQEVEGLPAVSQQAGQGLRPYWHVFAAYALVIVLVGGWAVSIARRLRDVEDRLVDGNE